MSKSLFIGCVLAFVIGFTFPTYLLSQVHQEIIVSRNVRVHAMELHDAIEGLVQRINELGTKVKINTDALETVMGQLKEQDGKREDVLSAINALAKDVLVSIQPEQQHRLEITHRLERLEVGLAEFKRAQDVQQERSGPAE